MHADHGLEARNQGQQGLTLRLVPPGSAMYVHFSQDLAKACQVNDVSPEENSDYILLTSQ